MAQKKIFEQESFAQEIFEKLESAGISQVSLARHLNRSASQVNHWKVGLKPIPLEVCTQFEVATKGAVMRWDLRPDDWHLIWPELKKRKDAPKVEVVNV